jgi:hypothetical protein
VGRDESDGLGVEISVLECLLIILVAIVTAREGFYETA